MWSFTKLGAYVIFWTTMWYILLPFRKKRHNCLTWAVEKWDADGGYLVVRWCRSNRSQWIRWPHFMWMSDDNHRHVVHLVPKKDEEDCHLFPKPWFEGRVIRGDTKETSEN